MKSVNAHTHTKEYSFIWSIIMLLHTAISTNTELLTEICTTNHHNCPKALVMTIFKILKLTTAANFIYTAKAEVYIFKMHTISSGMVSVPMPAHSNSFLTLHVASFHLHKSLTSHLCKSCFSGGHSEVYRGWAAGGVEQQSSTSQAWRVFAGSSHSVGGLMEVVAA